MKIRNKKTGEIKDGYGVIRICDGKTDICYTSLVELSDDWEDYTQKESLIKDEKIRKAIKIWSEINDIKEVEVYPLIFDHGGICIENSLYRFFNPQLRTSIELWLEEEYKLKKDLSKKSDLTYTITELCGEE